MGQLDSSRASRCVCVFSLGSILSSGKPGDFYLVDLGNKNW